MREEEGNHSKISAHSMFLVVSERQRCVMITKEGSWKVNG